ncbi:MAG: rhomboid family intramembrane serine protease, partial [bacterium]
GLVGVLFVFGIKFRHELPEGFKRAFGTGLLPMIMLNLFIGYLGRGLIDNAAHLGGLVSGAALALVVGYRRPGERSGIAFTWQALQYLAIGVVAVSFLFVVQHFRDPLPGLAAVQAGQNSADNGVTEFVAFAHVMNKAQEAFYGALQDGNTNSADDALKNLESAPHLDGKSDELRETLKQLLLEARKLQTNAPSSAGGNAQLQQQDLIRAFVSWSRQYNQWLKTSGKRYSGLVEVTEPSPEGK